MLGERGQAGKTLWQAFGTLQPEQTSVLEEGGGEAIAPFVQKRAC